MTTANRARRRAPLSTHLAVAACGTAAAALAGALAAWARAGQDPWAVFAVFTAATLAPALGLAWAALAWKHLPAPAGHPEDGVESRWYAQATSGALHDVVIAAGVLLAVVSVGGFAVDPTAVLTGVVVLALAGTAVRYAVLRHRGL